MLTVGLKENMSSAGARDLRVVAIGGGTGLSTLLRGFRKRTSHTTAVVTVTDDGGSSGRLREELGVLPPGDVRNCLVALADDESLMGALFSHRFTTGSLEGHSLGNLFLAALTQILGDFDKAVRSPARSWLSEGLCFPVRHMTCDFIPICRMALMYRERPAQRFRGCGEPRLAGAGGLQSASPGIGTYR